VFRRRAETAAPVETKSPPKEGGKGRPTPKRSEAEKRRTLVSAPKDRKEAYRLTRERQAEQRAKAKAGMAKGDSKYLPKRDQGPTRKLARDFVDARRTVGSYMMYLVLVTFALQFLFPFTAVLTPFILGGLLIEGFLISRAVRKLAAERFPDEDLKGVGMYAALRSLQMRRLRLPAPVLKPGDRDKV
jgi:hypothetical protein